MWPSCLAGPVKRLRTCGCSQRACQHVGMRLLVVEDEARLAHALRRGLAAEGFAVDVAADGAAGLEAARDADYDAVLLDVMLPRMSGYDVVRSLRAEENWVPVMMISAKDGPHDQADGLDCGADDYLTKPFSYVVLLARLRALLPAPPRVASAGPGPRRRPPRPGHPGGHARRRAGGADPAGARAAGVLPAPPGSGADEDRAAGPGVGRARAGGPQRRGGLCRLPPPQAGPRARRDRARRGLPPRSMSQPWRRWTLRTRLLLIGLLGLALAQAIGSVALYTALSIANRRAVDADANATATAVADLVRSGRLPSTIPVTGTEMVQVVDARGRVVSASLGADRLTPILERDELGRVRWHTRSRCPGRGSGSPRSCGSPPPGPGRMAGRR